MRTEFAWFVALQADHYPIAKLPEISEEYDLGIVILPKNVSPYLQIDIASEMNRFCKKTGFMQEGPSWYFQDLPLNESFWFFNVMEGVDYAFAHNEVDRQYYEGLLLKKSFLNPTLMIEDSINEIPEVKREKVIIGGNFVRWYGGFNSFVVANEFEEEIWAPRMGRMQKEELSLEGIQHLEYMEWREWIYELNTFKYAVHLNPNSIGGTFSLNCAYLGIPCIGNWNSNTQRFCFPDTSIQPDNIKQARELARELKNSYNFYHSVSERAKNFYNLYFSEKKYLETWDNILDEI